MLHPSTTTQFDKDKIKARKQGRDLVRLAEVMEKLIKEQALDAKHCDHPLKGDWKGSKTLKIFALGLSVLA